MVHLSISLLGPFAATMDGHSLDGFTSAKVRALLAYLTLEADRLHARQSLADLLWPDCAEGVARTYLRQALSNLRKLLQERAGDEPFLLIGRDTVQFNRRSAYRLDVADFIDLLAECDRHQHCHAPSCAACTQRCVTAVALYRGEMLEGLLPDASTVFEEWLTIRREELHQQAVQALGYLATCAGWSGRYNEMRAHAERQIALDAWREEAHCQLMQALALSGERSAALAQYERCRAILACELGVEPSSETSGLYMRICATVPNLPAGEARAKILGLPHALSRAVLPVPSTPFVGRANERAHLADLLQDPACRLITLVGPGGIGKTRLALHVAAEHGETFADGVFVVSLAPLRVAASLVPAIAGVVGVNLTGSSEPATHLLDHLRTREMLLVLDNAEHLLHGVEMVARILEHAPGLRLLVTSRERLSLQGEWVVELAGLDYPDSPLDLDGEAWQETFSAVALFVQSGHRICDGVALTAGDVPAVVRICRLAEGLPLALELAASWLRGASSCQEIAQEMERNLEILTTSFRDVPERHRSMRAVFEQSWRLLPKEEQRVLRRLAVFRGGFDRAAAMTVAGATLADLGRLVDRALVRHVGARYDLHELVRHYALSRLEKAGESEETHMRHLEVFLHLAEQAEPWLVSAHQGVWLERLEADGSNLRAAMEWALAHERMEAVIRLGGALWRFWWLRGHVDEGRSWLEAMGRLEPDPPVGIERRLWAQALHGAGWMSIRQRAFAQAAVLLEHSLVVARQTGDSVRCAAVLHDLGQSTRLQGQYSHAVSLFEEAAVLARQTGHARLEGIALGSTGTAWHAAGDDERARPLLEAGLALCRVSGDTVFMGWFLTFLGRVAKEQGDYKAAATYLRQAVATFQDLGDRDGLAFTLEGCAGLAVKQGDARCGACLFGAVETLREAIRAPLAPCDWPEYTRDVRCARAGLDEKTFTTAWAEGRVLTLEQIINVAVRIGRD